jgi:transcriptional regulator with XRE-family HTH domain
MAELQDPTVQRRKLRMELRRARDAAGMKQAQVARAMDWSPSKVIRIERGDVSVSTNDLKALLDYYGVKDQKRINELLALAKSSRGTSFYDQYGDIVMPGFKEYLAYEASASVIRQYDPLLMPGLLQTEEYARGIFTGMAQFGAERADRLWALRQHRQDTVNREDPPETLYVVDEAALRRHVGGRNTMRRQLERLKEFATEAHISIRVLPFTCGAHSGLHGAFVLLEFADPALDDLVHLETIRQVTIRDDTELIARYVDRFEQIQELSLSTRESVDFLNVLIRDMALPDSSNAVEKV